MLVFIQIDLSNADMPLFDEYEDKVLRLLGKYGGHVEERLRASDGRSEIHLLYFPHAEALNAFRADPTRASLQHLWTRCGAVPALIEVVRVE